MLPLTTNVVADTCGTLGLAAKVLIDNGASKVYAMVTHAVLSGKAVSVINASCLERLIVVCLYGICTL